MPTTDFSSEHSFGSPSDGVITAPPLSGPPRPRQCGRCRLFFVDQATHELSDDTTWWACPECRVKLFSHATRSRSLTEAAGVV